MRHAQPLSPRAERHPAARARCGAAADRSDRVVLEREARPGLGERRSNGAIIHRPHPHNMTLPPGTLLGPYEIVGLAGAGGMGEVYRARDPRLQRTVAIKILPPSFATDPDRLRRFEHEARAAGSLNHPNIVAVYDVGAHEVSPYLVTEFLEGQTLRDKLLSRLSVAARLHAECFVGRSDADYPRRRSNAGRKRIARFEAGAGGGPGSFVRAVPAGWRCTGGREWIRRRGHSGTLERRRKVDLVGRPVEWCTSNHAD